VSLGGKIIAIHINAGGGSNMLLLFLPFPPRMHVFSSSCYAICIAITNRL
jgi:hypothetical protein